MFINLTDLLCYYIQSPKINDKRKTDPMPLIQIITKPRTSEKDNVIIIDLQNLLAKDYIYISTRRKGGEDQIPALEQ